MKLELLQEQLADATTLEQAQAIDRKVNGIKNLILFDITQLIESGYVEDAKMPALQKQLFEINQLQIRVNDVLNKNYAKKNGYGYKGTF